MKRLFTAKYKVSRGKASWGNYTTGKIIINSKRLRHVIGNEVRVIIYLIGTNHYEKQNKVKR